MRYMYIGIALLLSLTLCSCGGAKKKEQNSAEKYFMQGERYLEKNLYEDAIASWEKVLDTFYSPELSMLAELKIAETYYVSKRYDEAAMAFSDFLDKHPNDFRVATVLYRLGLSYYHQILSADRDQTATENALITFKQLVQRFPDSPNAQEAKHLILRCRTRLAEHEVYIGTYYLKVKRYQPAIKRLEAILADFPEYYYRDEAFYQLGKAYLKTQQQTKAQEIFQQLFDQFPGSDYVEKAQDLLKDATE